MHDCGRSGGGEHDCAANERSGSEDWCGERGKDGGSAGDLRDGRGEGGPDADCGGGGSGGDGGAFAVWSSNCKLFMVDASRIPCPIESVASLSALPLYVPHFALLVCPATSR